MAHIHEEYDFTVSAFVLHPTEPKILLIMHKKLDKWLQPGGHVELNEDPWSALTHELEEEAGLKLDECELLFQPSQPTLNTHGYTTLPIPFHKMFHDFNPDGSHKHIDDCYLLRSYTADVNPEEGESKLWKWFSKEEIRNLDKNDEIFESTRIIADWIFDNQV